jgi:hypothetical protein
MSMNYLTYAIRVANLIPVNLTNTQFQNMLPSMIEYAELRIYRELNLLETRVATEVVSTPNTRNFTLPVPPAGPYITVVGINIVTPANTSLAAGGVRNSIPSRSRMLVDYVCPTDVGVSAATVPQMYYMRDQNTAIIGPASQSTYFVEVIGTIRPNPLSETNPTTFLTEYFPDLFTAASMVFAGNYMRDFGQEAGAANIAQGWEQQYQTLFAGANNEETRKRYNDEVNKQ